MVKLKNNILDYIKIPKERQSTAIEIERETVIKVDQNNLNSNSWSFLSLDQSTILNKLSVFSNIRETYGKCYYGVKTALNDAFILSDKWPNSEHVKQIYEGKEIKKWNTPSPKQKLIFFKSRWTRNLYGVISEEEAFEKVKGDFPRLMNHLLPFKELAKKRYDKGEFWWELRNCAYYDLFEKPKIIFPNLQNTNKFSFDSNGIFLNAPAVFLPTSSKSLLCVLNSKVIWFFLKSICVVRSGGYIEVKPQYFEQIPVPEVQNKEAFIQKADAIISFTANFQSLQSQFLELLQNKFGIEKPTKNVQTWHRLEFKGFLAELKKAKVKLSLSEEAEWMVYFNEQNQKALAIQQQVEQTDREIDQLVYGLYGLDAEEIKIIEQSV